MPLTSVQIRPGINKSDTPSGAEGQWVSKIKARDKVKIIDVPMVEWVTQSYIQNGSYDIFDEIWCLTDLTKSTFKTSNSKRVSFNFVDEKVFYPPNSREKDEVIYYHAGSLNKEYSSKNTDKVISAFKRFLKEDNPSAKLLLTGLKESYSNDNHTNIIYIGEAINRDEIGIIYRKADVLLSPSEKEGLGLSLYEAQACECKIITTDAPPRS